MPIFRESRGFFIRRRCRREPSELNSLASAAALLLLARASAEPVLPFAPQNGHCSCAQPLFAWLRFLIAGAFHEGCDSAARFRIWTAFAPFGFRWI